MRQAHQHRKTHEEARRSHLALQARREALARLRQGEVVEIRLAGSGGRPGDLVTVRALGEKEWPEYYQVLAVINRRLRAGWCSNKDGLRVGPRRLDTKDILGVVLLVNGVSPYTTAGEFWEQLRATIERHPMSVNLHCRVPTHPHLTVTLIQTPTYITRMCLYADLKTKEKSPWATVMQKYLEWVKEEFGNKKQDWDTVQRETKDLYAAAELGALEFSEG